MRILHLLEPADGGVATHVRDLAHAQVARGHAVQAVVSSRGALADDLRDGGVGVVALDLRPEMVAPRADAQAAAAIARLLQRRRWDVVHTHESKAGVLARPVAHRLGYAVVHSPHTYAYMTQELRGRGAARRMLTFGVERLLSAVSDVVIVPSRHLRDRAVADSVVSADRVMVVAHGHDPPPRTPPDAGLPAPGRGPVVGFLSRMTPEKDPLTLVEALARTGVRAALVGDGPLAGEVERRLRALGLEERVRVRPFAGAAPALAAFDIYVLPSLRETFAIGLLEAMAAGLPAVATRVGAIPELAVEGETALLVEPGDPVALAAAIGRLASDPDLRARLGDAARARAAAFTVAAMAEQTDSAYERARARRWASATS